MGDKGVVSKKITWIFLGLIIVVFLIAVSLPQDMLVQISMEYFK